MASYAPGSSSPQIAPEDLLTLLAVARLGKFTAAAHSLGLNHTTVSRRIAALEKAYGDRVLVASPDGWELSAAGRQLLPIAEDIEAALGRIEAHSNSALSGTIRLACPQAFALEYAVPALTELQAQHPGLQIELITATQRARQYRSGVDIEIVVGRPDAPRSIAKHIRDYRLQLYASQDYISSHPMPQTLNDLADHRMVYYIENSLRVDDLDEPMPFPVGQASSGPPRCMRMCSRPRTVPGSASCPTSSPTETPAWCRCCPSCSPSRCRIGPRSATSPYATPESAKS